jgi:hypothetical protein
MGEKMKHNMIDDEIMEMLISCYSRVSNNVCFNTMLNTTIIFVGVGASGFMIEQFARLGVGGMHLFDNDIVEIKNLTSQNFTYDDVGLQKDEAIIKRLKSCEFEKDNPSIPPLELTAHGDFLKISDSEIEMMIQNEQEKGHQVILVLASDYHPVQARGNRISLKFEIPTFWVGIYRKGMAGEIVFYVSNHDLPCYRCITESRYRFFDKKHLISHLKGDFRGSGRSSGLPPAATFIDAILSHLIFGVIHIEDDKNQHAKLFRRLLKEKRNFIQCQLDPTYKLNDTEDIFAQMKGTDFICFNTIFQHESRKLDCIDCREFAIQLVWKETDYTKENYRESLIAFSMIEEAFMHGLNYDHPLLNEYEHMFPQWEKHLNSVLKIEDIREITIERNGTVIGYFPLKNQYDVKHINNIIPGLYSIKIDNDQIIWCGEFTEQHLIWNSAFPERPVELAADTGNSKTESTLKLKLLNGQITISILPGIESGCLQIKTGELDLD